jgi:hypothetical protein
MEILGNDFGAKKGTNNYYCKLCDYKCFKKYDWSRHILTAKHCKEISGNDLEMNLGQKGQKCEIYQCDICEKQFKSNAGLWKHKKKCNTASTNQIISKDEPTDKELILKILKQNSELIKENSELRKEQTDIKELILEIVKNGTMNNSHNTTHTNSHNKAFNLNFFLNETCKNAMNITDFVDSIKLQLTDLMEVGELGYVEGISKIIVKNLNNLDETIRPVHCTDKKRETMYVKDEGHWEKEDDNKTRLKKVINKVADKNIRLLPQFREKYPEYRNSSSKISDVHDKLVIEVMETDNDKKDKIISNISKSTTISNKGV